jgi:hypothetical protein
VFGFTWVLGLWVQVETGKRALHDLEEGAWREFAVAAVNPDPQVRLRGLAQLDEDLRLGDQLRGQIERDQLEYDARQQTNGWLLRQSMRQMDKEMQRQMAVQESEGIPRVQGKTQPFRWQAAARLASMTSIKSAARFLGVLYTITLVFWPVTWVIWSLVWRGGLSLRWLGLSLARSDGRRAARWQCALRDLVVWTPLLALWTASLWLDVWYFVDWTPSEPLWWVPWLSSALWWIGLLLLPLYALLATLYPRRCLHDWVAGTYLVPR